MIVKHEVFWGSIVHHHRQTIIKPVSNTDESKEFVSINEMKSDLEQDFPTISHG
jgi:hypothetical protein